MLIDEVVSNDTSRPHVWRGDVALIGSAAGRLRTDNR
jgi:hypothetical protein